MTAGNVPENSWKVKGRTAVDAVGSGKKPQFTDGIQDPEVRPLALQIPIHLG